MGFIFRPQFVRLSGYWRGFLNKFGCGLAAWAKRSAEL